MIGPCNVFLFENLYLLVELSCLGPAFLNVVKNDCEKNVYFPIFFLLKLILFLSQLFRLRIFMFENTQNHRRALALGGLNINLLLWLWLDLIVNPVVNVNLLNNQRRVGSDWTYAPPNVYKVVYFFNVQPLLIAGFGSTC